MTSHVSRDPTRDRKFYEELLRENDFVNENSSSVLVDTAVSPSPDVRVQSTPILDGGPPSSRLPPARPPLQPVPQLVTSRATAATVAVRPRATTTEAPILNRLNNVWDGLREMLGINHHTVCLNGGTRGPGGRCHCPKLFQGSTCERRVCLNGGNLTRTTAGPVAYECKCPFPQYIEGAHCETVRCANQAPLVRQNGTWQCDCTDRMFYKGQFCETFSAPYAVLAVPVICLLIFLVCCFLCRIDWCPRKQPRRARAQPAARGGQPPRRRAAPRPQTARAVRGPAARLPPTPQQEFLLPHECGGRGATAAYPATAGPPYVIRLDTIPTFNPNMIGGVEPPAPSKPIEPPPSYDQAILGPPAPEPPRYTERPSPEQSLPVTTVANTQPPPPNRSPPNPPS